MIRERIIHGVLMCWFGNKDIRKTITTADSTLSRIFKMKQNRRWSKGSSFIMIHLRMSQYGVDQVVKSFCLGEAAAAQSSSAEQQTRS